ncbi:hypothetical protein B9Z55_017698 [Caenorhabditis nigoni]|uniref:NR LBD domain-containing protein n=2 Tax=Caenorhabditis nigoni TaxID=1611254 RepID=A0A2G5TA88_9PELO|nr:hypothetical protein B9Z55_017698 [Caenorhabditis nigoni]
MDTFLGRTNLIIFNAPNPDQPTGMKHFIDVRYLVQQAKNILKSGSPTPVFGMSSLEKLALGLRESSQNSKTTTITKVGKDETLAFWQSDMIKVTKWFTYFDEFQLLPFQLRIQMIKGIWRVWSRLNRLATSMKARRQQICEDNMMMIDLKEESVVFHLSKTQIDLSWQSNYNVEQLKLFGYRYLDEKTELLIQEIINLEPSDVELSYMLCQLCFYYLGKRFQGVLQEIADRLLEVLSNNLHDYYMNQMGCSKYSGRIAGLMKINNQIQKGIYERRAKAELMKIFDVFFVEYSDPEMFVDA